MPWVFYFIFLYPECSVVTAGKLLGVPSASELVSGLQGGSSFMWVKEGGRLLFALRRVLEFPFCIAVSLAKGALTLDLELNDRQGRACWEPMMS